MPLFDYEELADNVRDWFYTYCKQDCYDSIDDFIDDIRYAIAYSNDTMVTMCMDDLVSTYNMCYDCVESYHDSIADILAEESQASLDNFTYPGCE